MNVQELEKQLAQAKKNEQEQQLQKQLKETKDLLEGKCFSSHLFGRKSYKLKEVSLLYIEKVHLHNNTIVTKETTISFYMYSNKCFKFERNTFDNCDASRCAFDRYRYPISLNQFMSVWKQTEAQFEITAEIMRKGLNEPIEQISIGDAGNERVEIKLLNEVGVPLIDLSNYRWKQYILAELLSWGNHPFCIAGKYLVNNRYAKNICLKMISDLKESAFNWGGVIYERDIERAEAIEDFVNKITWLD